MELNYYQTEAHKTAIYPEEAGIMYPVLGLCGEAGEVAEKVKKLVRDTDYLKTKRIDAVDHVGVEKELSDVLWYLSECCTKLGVSLQHIAELNLTKLASRKERGVLSGSGDDR